MPEQALYLKWRPLSFDDVVGQHHITRTLRNALARERIRHAYLFSGPRGTGKTTTARLLAKAVNCKDQEAAARPCNSCANCNAINEGRYLDLIEIDAASHTGVDDVRELRDKIAFAPGEGAYKVYIIDEVHRFSGNAFDALLKTLEEPPDHALFVLATTEIDKVPATIKSRCLQFEFRRVSLRELTERLAYIAGQESLSIEPAAIELIARQGTGSVRDSISLLDQIVADPAETITLEMAQHLLGTASAMHVHELVEALVEEDVARGIHMINMAIDGGSDPRQFGQQLVNVLRNIMLAQTATADLIEATQEEQARYDALAKRIERARLLKAIRAFNAAVNNYTGGWQPQLSLELAYIGILQQDIAATSPATPPHAAQTPRPHMRAGQRKTSAGHTVADEDFERATASQPGETPVFSVATIRQGWIDILTQVHRYNRNIPALLEHAHVRLIDGNRLILGVPTEIFKQKIVEPKRAKVIEQAIFDLHEVKLRVEVRVSDSVLEHDESAPAEEPTVDDPLIAAGKELGGVVDE
ncbi:MAG: DNA polymerase III subunit gamma/tau [Chloroflexi bacterium]|nr:DNA polymerase III subunit gamma/tau [Chloroflexota bacterium]